MRSTEEKIKRKVISVVIIVAILSMMAGCGKSQSRKEPITLTIWHVYGGQTDSPLNDLIDEFNGTEGKKEGIKIQVGMVSNTNTIHEEVLKAANKDPGAAKLPDLFISYPKTVLAMNDSGILADYHDYFSENELKDFIPEFLKEGEIDGRLLVFPVAKSTEILFVNKTIFDRFSADTGASMEQLTTWEDLFDLADTYYEWSDAQTPDVEGDGKSMFVHDYHFNYFQVGVESLGENFFKGENLAFGPEFETAWEPYAKAALSGGVWLRSGYATEPLRTGDSIVSVASSASVLYYSDEVSYEDNTSEKIEIVAMPCPVFSTGEKMVMQRGAGICTVKSTPDKEKACITFLKWLTETRKNVEFVTSLGYMPVKQEAFDACLPEAIKELSDPMYVSLYQAFLDTQENYTFYTAPQLDSYLDLETRFEELVRKVLLVKRQQCINKPENIDKLVKETLADFKVAYTQ